MFAIRGAGGDVLVGVCARTRFAGGHFFFLSSDGMVWHQSVRKNKILSPRARTRNLEGRPPQGGDLKQKQLFSGGAPDFG